MTICHVHTGNVNNKTPTLFKRFVTREMFEIFRSLNWKLKNYERRNLFQNGTLYYYLSCSFLVMALSVYFRFMILKFISGNTISGTSYQLRDIFYICRYEAELTVFVTRNLECKIDQHIAIPKLTRIWMRRRFVCIHFCYFSNNLCTSTFMTIYSKVY